MHLESFHRKLKVVYLESKQNRRLDHLLHVLLKISRDIIFESFRKFEIGKLSHRKCEIRRRHMRAINLDPEFVQTSGKSDSEWIVKSSTDELSVYYVKLDKKVVIVNCIVTCAVPVYTCTLALVWMPLCTTQCVNMCI